MVAVDDMVVVMGISERNRRGDLSNVMMGDYIRCAVNRAVGV